MTKKEHIKIHLKSAYEHLQGKPDLDQVEFDIFEVGEILGIKAKEINARNKYRYIVTDCKNKKSSFHKTERGAIKDYMSRWPKDHLGILKHDIKKDLYLQIY